MRRRPRRAHSPAGEDGRGSALAEDPAQALGLVMEAVEIQPDRKLVALR